MRRQSDPLGTDHFEVRSRWVQLRRCFSLPSCGLLSYAAARSPQHAVVLAPTQEVSFFVIDAWPRSFVVIVFLVVLEKGDDFSSRGTLSTGLCPNGTIKFRCGTSSATEPVIITSRPLDGFKVVKGLRCAAHGSHTWRGTSWRGRFSTCLSVCRLRRQGNIELTERLFFGDHLSCGR